MQRNKKLFIKEPSKNVLLLASRDGGNAKNSVEMNSKKASLSISYMELAELIDASTALHMKMNGIQTEKSFESKKINMLLKSVSVIGGKLNQEKLLNNINKRILVLNAQQHKPSQEAKLKYEQLLSEKDY